MVNFVCLKWGTKYDAEYVNRMYVMLKRNCKEQFTLYCCTEDPSGISNEIQIVPLPIEKYDLETYWWKLWILSKEFPVDGKCIFFDLDTVIQNDIQEIVDFECGEDLYVLFTQWRVKYRLTTNEYYTYTNSSIMIWNIISEPDIFSHYIKNNYYYEMKYHGNDEYLELEHPERIKTLPTHWVYSRLAGYDDSDDERADDYRTDVFVKEEYNVFYRMWNMPERMICLFNAIGEYHTDRSIYNNYEHYWSDSMS